MFESMKPHVAHLVQDFFLGLVGAGAPVLAVIASWQEQMEWGLRILAMILGCMVSLITIYIMIFRKKE